MEAIADKTIAPQQMTESYKRTYLKGYFNGYQIGKDRSFLGRTNRYITAAVVVPIILYFFNVYLAILAAIGLGGALYALYHYDTKQRQQGDDSIVDQIRKSDVADLLQRGRVKLNISKISSDEALSSSDINLQQNSERVIVGPVISTRNGVLEAENVCMRKGKDGNIRFSCYEYTFVYLTQNYIAIYRCLFDSLESSTKIEKLVEYNYQDITAIRSVETDEELMLYGKEVKIKTLSFEISVPNDSVSVAVSSASLKDTLEGNLIDVSTDEDLNLIRTFVREQKQKKAS